MPLHHPTGPLHRRVPLALATLVLATACSASPAAEPGSPVTTTGGGGRVDLTLDVPGAFPEGIACDHATGDVYVGSTADGAVYRGNVDEPGALEEVLPAGEDGRTSLTGIKVDGEGRLWAAGRRTGRVFVYDLADRALVESWETGEGGLVNDLTFADGGTYITDSFRPTLWRVPDDRGEPGAIEPWLDLEGTPIPVQDGFNLNGITGSDDGSAFLTVHYATGQLFRVDVASQEIVEVDLGGEDLRTGDGLLLDGTTLLAVVNEPEPAVVRIEMAPDLASGEVVERVTDPSFDFPTTLGQCGEDRVQVLNSQLDDEGGEAQLPFTVTDLPIDVP